MKLVARLACAAVALLGLSAAHAAFVATSASGADAASIATQVNAFRGSLGTLNPNVAGSFGSGRREINWDGVPDARSAPNNLPANFFNVNSPRGVVFATPGSGFQVSANAINPTGTPVEFGNINPAYPQLFAPFSAQRLFTALGSNIIDIEFFVPGSTTPATTSAFGAVFTDVDLANVTTLQIFYFLADSGAPAVDVFSVPAFSGDETFSFLGVRANAGERIGRVRITAGNVPLSGAASAGDVVAIDDFIYAEPLAAAVPEPSTMALLAAAALLLGRRRCGRASDSRRG